MNNNNRHRQIIKLQYPKKFIKEIKKNQIIMVCIGRKFYEL